ncbi:hypothetical protein J6590_019242 [Homalodisca vitripennis]|nr:hypothetical protein J6590_019242 [Homalodisca vitripennis]
MRQLSGKTRVEERGHGKTRVEERGHVEVKTVVWVRDGGRIDVTVWCGGGWDAVLQDCLSSLCPWLPAGRVRPRHHRRIK